MLKTVSSITNAIGALNYKGTWDASANNPTLVSSVGTKGDYYVVSVAGSTNLNGETLWGVGDMAVFNGSAWQKVDGGDTSVVSGLTVTTLTGYMYSNNTAGVTASTSIPVANVTGAVPNTVNVLAGGLLSGGGALTANVTISLSNVPAANVTGLGTIATQNANAVTITGGNVTATITSSNVTITGGTINNVAHTDGSFANANVTSVATTFPNSYLANSNVIVGNTTISLGSTSTSVGNLTLNNVTINGGSISNVTLSNANPSIVTKTANYTVTVANQTVLANTSSGNLTITLLTSINNSGKIYTIKKMDSTANVVVVATTSNQTIDGASTYNLASQYVGVSVQSDGANWVIIGSINGRNGTAGTF